MNAAASRDAAAAALCRQCGLCCDGTLFTHVPLTDVEATRLATLGLPVDGGGGGGQAPALRQRCGALAGFDCRIYLDRPSPCRVFRCHQLIALSEGEATLEESSAHVRQAQLRVATLAEALRLPGSGGEVLREARRQVQAGTAPSRVGDALQALERFLRTHFTGRHGL